MASDQKPFQLLRRRLERSCDLSSAELDALHALPYNLRSYPANTDLMREGDRPSQGCYIVEGFLYRFKFVSEGSRQIMSFHLPGDFPDLQSLFLARADHYLATLTPAVVAFIPHDALLELTLQHPRLGHCLWRDTLIDAAIFREWIINIGRRSALGRIAHLLCEQTVRLKQVGLGRRNWISVVPDAGQPCRCHRPLRRPCQPQPAEYARTWSDRCQRHQAPYPRLGRACVRRRLQPRIFTRANSTGTGQLGSVAL